MQRGGLEIAEDAGFQRRQWRFERAGAVVLACAVVAAGLGVFGPGLASRTRTSVAGGALVVDYPRFARRLAPLRVSVSAPVEARGARELRVWLAADYLARATLAHVTPPPERVELAADGQTYVFARDPEAGVAVVVFELEPLTPGRMRGRIGTRPDDAVELGHFVYP